MNEKRRFRAEYAKRSTGTCKDRDCSGKIEKGELRIAIVVKVGILLENETTSSECFFRSFQSCYFDGDENWWHHPKCFFQKYNVKSEFSIDGFARLRYEDQQILRHFMGKYCCVNFSSDHLKRL